MKKDTPSKVIVMGFALLFLLYYPTFFEAKQVVGYRISLLNETGQPQHVLQTNNQTMIYNISSCREFDCHEIKIEPVNRLESWKAFL